MKDPRRDGEPEAVGLRYQPEGDAAPRVVARGRGEVARRIREVAEEHGVPVRSDPDLLELLAQARLGDEVPEALYGVVAELIAFLWRVNESAPGSASAVVLTPAGRLHDAVEVDGNALAGGGEGARPGVEGEAL